MASGWPGGRGDAGALAELEGIEAGLTVAGEGGSCGGETDSIRGRPAGVPTTADLPLIRR